MAKLIKTDGTTTVVEPQAKDRRFHLKELQDYVGGYIEIVHLGTQLMIVNEEGLIRDLPTNYRASEIAGQMIAGDVVICKNGEVD